MRQTRTFPAATPTSPRVLKTADEAPCGSLLKDRDGDITLRLSNGTGRHLGPVPHAYSGPVLWTDDTMSRNVFTPIEVIAEGLTEAECRHLSGLSAQEAIAWCEARAKRPQPGDVVPWAEVEDGALYHDADDKAFLLRISGRWVWAWDPNAEWVAEFVRSRHGNAGVPVGYAAQATLVARDLGTDPEAWRRAMREWTANGNRPPVKKPMWINGVFTPEGQVVLHHGPFVTGPTGHAPASAADHLAPLRAVMAARACCFESELGNTPALVRRAAERISADGKEIERLKAANMEARAALETPGRQGLRARLAKAEAERDAATRALEAQRATHILRANEAQRRIDAYEVTIAGQNNAQTRKTASLEAEAVTRRAELETVKTNLQKANQRHACSVFALTAQRDEARSALADEKIKTTALENDVGTLRRLLDGRFFFPVELLEPLRALVPASAVNAEQVVAAVGISFQRIREDRDRYGARAVNAEREAREWRDWARPLWPEGPPNPADAAIRSAIEARVTRGIPLPNEEALSALRKALPANLHDDPSEGRTGSDMVHGAVRRLLHLEQWGRSMTVALQAATERAEKAERNLRAAAELLAA